MKLPEFTRAGKIYASIGVAALAWAIDSIVDSLLFREHGLSAELFSPTAEELYIRLVWAGLLVVALNLVFLVSKYRRAENRIRFLAYYDALTGLPNRTFFKELLSRAIIYAQRYNTTVALLYLDLDNFKRINDTFGHDTGDRLLQTVAERVAGVLRKTDSIARPTDEESVASRLGGDEFVILLQNVGRIMDVGRVAQRILKGFSNPFKLDGREVFVTASIGICMYPSGGEETEDLMKNADIAMYHAKAQGKNNYQFYSEDMNARAIETFNLERDLRKAIEQEDFILHYQPKFQASSKKIVGMEALLRWNHKERGIVPPMEFIPLAEETGLIVPLGERVLFMACQQASAWAAGGFENANISVNLSARQFGQKNLLDVIGQTLRTTGLPPRCLELEITESAVMRMPEEAIAVLHELKSMGVHISVDDFGTGFSSLNYLRRLPIDSLKIDRSFIMNVAANSADAAVVKGIIALAHSLNLKVIAEGVETEGQFGFLREAGCDEVQGYLFSRPLPAGEVVKFLQ